MINFKRDVQNQLRAYKTLLKVGQTTTDVIIRVWYRNLKDHQTRNI